MYMDIPDLIQCPYDTSHLIKPERFPHHLDKCARNHPEVQLVVCPYNSSHRILYKGREDHIRECSDRKNTQVYRHPDENLQRGDLRRPPVFGSDLIIHYQQREVPQSEFRPNQSIRATDDFWNPQLESRPNSSRHEASKPVSIKPKDLHPDWYPALNSSPPKAAATINHIGLGRGFLIRKMEASVSRPGLSIPDE